MTDTLDLRPPQRSARGMIGVPTTLTASLLDADGEPKEAEAVDLYIGGPISASWPLPDPLGDVTKITGTLDEETGLWMLAVPGLSAGTVLLRLVVDGALVGRLLHHVGSRGSASPTTELVVRDGADLVLHLSTAITAPGDLATVATTGDYDDLTGKPSIPATAADVDAVPTTRTVAGKALSADVTLTASDVGADPEGAAANAVTALPEVDTSPTVDAIETDGILRHHRAVSALGVAPLSPVGNSTSVLSIITSTVPIPGGLMAPGGHVARLSMGGLLRNTSGVSVTATIRIMYGSTALVSTVVALANHASDRPWGLDAWFGAISAFGLDIPTGLSVLHLGAPGDSGPDTASYTRTTPSAILDTSITQHLDVTVQFSAADAGIALVATAGRLDWSRIR